MALTRYPGSFWGGYMTSKSNTLVRPIKAKKITKKDIKVGIIKPVKTDRMLEPDLFAEKQIPKNKTNDIIYGQW